MVSPLKAIPHSFAVVSISIASLTGPKVISQDAGAVSTPPAILSRSLAAMLPSGTSLSDITVQGTIEYTAGSTDANGTISFKGTSDGSSRIDLSLPAGTTSESVVFANGKASAQRSGIDGKIVSLAQHNLLVNSAWFSPALLLQQFTSTWDVVDLGATPTSGSSLEQLICVRPGTSGDPRIDRVLQRLSTMNILIDPLTGYPAILKYNLHPENDAFAVNQKIEVDYADYQTLGGIMVPTHIRKIVNGVLLLNINITSVSVNTGLVGSQFALQS